MDTSYLRERLAHQVAGEVFDGADPAAAAETAGFNTSVTHRPAVVVAARTAADVAAAVRTPATRGSRSPSRPPGTAPRRRPRARCSSRPRRMQGAAGRPGRPGRAGRGRRALAAGDRRRRTARAGAAVRLVVGRRASSATRSAAGWGTSPAGTASPPTTSAPVELVTADGEIRDGHRAERPGAVLGAAWRPGQLRHRHRARVRPGPGAALLRRRHVLHRRRHRAGAARLRRLGADPAGGGHDLGRAAAAAAVGRRAAAAARDGQPGPALRLHRLARGGRRAARADAGGRRRRCSTRSARCRTPRSTGSTWTRRSRCPRSPAGRCSTGCPTTWSTRCSPWPGPGVDVPLAVVELRLMGGALGRPGRGPERGGGARRRVRADRGRARAAAAGGGRPGVDRAGGRGAGAVVDRHVAGQLRRPRRAPGSPWAPDVARAAAPGEGGGGPPRRLRRRGLARPRLAEAGAR